MKIICKLCLLGILVLLIASCRNISKISKLGVPEADDYRLFASRMINTGSEPFHFFESEHDLNLGETIEVDSRKIDATDRQLGLFLKDYKTLSFLIIRNDTILYRYFDESIQDSSILTSFSVSKAFLSALVGIAIAEGNIPGTSCSITTYFP